jgi:hypothetical protein
MALKMLINETDALNDDCYYRLLFASFMVQGILRVEWSDSMNEKSWETLKVQYCEHVDQSVNLQA